MKSKLFAIAAVISSLVASNAATINIVRSGAGTGIQAQTSAGTNLTTGGYFVGVGTFAVAPTITDQDSFVSAVNNFSLAGSFLAPTTGTTVGLLVGSFDTINTAFNSAALYLLVGNGTTRANSTEFAIIQGTPGFVFPANVGVAGGTNYTLGNATQISPVGVAGLEIDNATGFDVIQLRALAPIPEPSTALLGLLGIAGLIRRRR
jgi:PEP-CTERM motif